MGQRSIVITAYYNETKPGTLVTEITIDAFQSGLSSILEVKKLQGAVEAKRNADWRAKNATEKQFPIPNVMWPAVGITTAMKAACSAVGFITHTL